MSWHYQIRHRIDKGQDLYDVVEVYESPLGWTKDSIAPVGETPGEVLDELSRMFADGAKYPVLEDIEEAKP